MFHDTLLDAHFTSFFSTPCPAVAPSSMALPSLLFLSFGEFNPCTSARRVALWPSDRTVPFHSWWIKVPRAVLEVCRKRRKRWYRKNLLRRWITRRARIWRWLKELGFVAGAVSDSVGWHRLLRIKFMCEKKCKKEGFNFNNITAMLVENRKRT